MNEINFKKNKVNENIDANQLSTLPPEIRIKFQYLMLDQIGFLHFNDKKLNLSDEQKKAEQIKENQWVEEYGKKISLIIDNPINIQIRDLILNNRFEEASPLVLEKLDIKIKKAGE